MKIKQFDCVGFKRDELKARFAFFPPIIIDVAFLFTLIVTIGKIIAEKETKMKVNIKLKL